MDEKFLPVVHVLDALNALGCTFTFERIGMRLYIHGITCDIGILLGLLWSKVNNFVFYPCDKGIEVLYLER